MESDLGKLFIGGISWDTNEDRLKEYFQAYGEVVETVIMKDRTTGRARGFGFVVFAEPAVAERVVSEKHTIDGRMVEAKKAVPRDDQHILNRNTANMHGSPGPAHTKKIFVGGLASTVTETDFKKYFSQFGTITDVVVMYDHNTQRPRGFGFITYDSEDAVDKVLLKTFHELNGKMVEVKRAVPKELSPGANRSPLTGYNYSVNRLNSFPNGYAQGYNLSSPGGYGVRMDGRFSPIASTRGGFTPFGPSDIGLGMNFESSLSSSSGSATNFGSNLIYGRGVNPYYIGNSGRYANSIGYSGGNGESGPALSLTGRNVWGNSSYNLSSLAASSNAYTGSGNWSNGLLGNNGVNWGSAPSISGQVGMSKPSFDSGDLGYGSGGNRYGGLGGAAYGTNNETTVAPASYSSSNSYYDGAYGNLYSGSLVHEDPTWRSSISELDEPTSFGYGIGNAASDVSARSSTGYIGGYNVTSNQSDRGVAA